MADEAIKYNISTSYDGSGFAALGSAISKSKDAVTSLQSSFGMLAASFGGIGIATKIFSDAIRESSEAQEIWRRLDVTLAAVGISLQKNRAYIVQWSDAMRIMGMENDAAADALGTAATRMGNLEQAMKAVQLAQNIAMATGKNFSEILDAITRAASGSSRGMMMLRQMFGEQLSGVENVSVALDKLAKNYDGAAAAAKGFAVAQNQASIEWSELMEELGNAATAGSWFQDYIAVPVLKFLRATLVAIGAIGALTFATIALVWNAVSNLVNGIGLTLWKLATLDFAGAWQTAKDSVSYGLSELKQDFFTFGHVARKSMSDIGKVFSTPDAAALVSSGGFKATPATKEKDKTKAYAYTGEIYGPSAIAEYVTYQKELEEVARAAAVRHDAIIKQTAEFDGEMRSERGQAWTAFFDKSTIDAARASIQSTASAKAALDDLQNKYDSASKTISGGWRQAMIDTAQTATNWKTTFTGAINGVTSNFSSSFKSIVVAGGNMFTMLSDLATAFFQSILDAFMDMISQMVAELAIFGLLDLFTGGWFGGLTGGLGGFMGFATGGYTGSGAVNQIAGFAHAEEFVLPAGVTSAFGLQGKSVSEAVSTIAGSGAGAGGYTVNAPVTVNVNGGISSELDVKKVCKAIGEATKYNMKEAVYMANVLSKQGSKKAGYAI